MVRRLDNYRSSLSGERKFSKVDNERFVSVYMPPREGFNNQRQALSVGMCRGKNERKGRE